MANVLTFKRRRRWRYGARRSHVPGFPAFLIVGAILGLAYVDFGPVADAARSTVMHLSGAPTAELGPRVSSVSFSLCGRYPHTNCVMDGDTFYLGSQSIRIADIDAPETHPSRCATEAALGARATYRLQELLNAGPFALHSLADRDTDQYGRKLRTVIRDGRSVGGILVSEGLARRWTGYRRPWCA
jgi:endonuclease YncB( thermonuclease family)